MFSPFAWRTAPTDGPERGATEGQRHGVRQTAVERAFSSRTGAVTVGAVDPVRDDKREAPMGAGTRSTERVVPIAKSVVLSVN